MAHPKQLLSRLGIRARKNLSQNFLLSPHWADRLVDAALAQPHEEVWEVGPGLGALTERLASRSPVPVKLFELDRTLSGHLRETFPQLELVEGDFLKQDWESLAQGRDITLVSNLPYAISSPLLFGLLERAPFVKRWVLTFQKEFSDRLRAVPRSSHYSALSVRIQLQIRMTSLGVLPPKAFFPVPDVDSEGLVMEPIRILPPKVGELVRAAFAHRRKQLPKNLKALDAGRDWAALLTQLGWDPRCRPEELSPQDYLTLARAAGIAPIDS